MAFVSGTFVSFVLGRVVYGVVIIRAHARRHASELRSGGLEQRLAEN